MSCIFGERSSTPCLAKRIYPTFRHILRSSSIIKLEPMRKLCARTRTGSPSKTRTKESYDATSTSQRLSSTLACDFKRDICCAYRWCNTQDSDTHGRSFLGSPPKTGNQLHC